MGDKAKKAENRALRIAENVDPIGENHMQVFRRLSDPIFLTGAMHGTPGKRPKKNKS